MKTKNTLKFITALCMAGILFVSCQSDSDNIVSEEIIEEFSALAVQTDTEVDNVTDDISSIIDQTFDDVEYSNKSENDPTHRFLPDCATVTSVVTATTKDVTIDFGERCELKNGNIVSGVINMHYLIDKTALTRTVEITFDNFYNNDKKIEGSFSMFKERANVNGNPQSINTFNVTVTWPDGTFASKNGTKTTELIEGKNTRVWGDNVFSITGNWSFTRVDSTVHVTTITTPLRKELSCRFIVSGVIALQKDDLLATLDFGDGTCDDLGELTINGVTETIHLRRR